MLVTGGIVVPKSANELKYNEVYDIATVVHSEWPKSSYVNKGTVYFQDGCIRIDILPVLEEDQHSLLVPTGSMQDWRQTELWMQR